MKLYILSFLLIFSLVSCKSENKTNASEEKNDTLTEAQKIANAHGINNWDKVQEIAFTFNVDRDSSHFERSWTWKPKTDDVTLITATDTIRYNRKSIDSTSLSADQSFINDKFWLLAPYQLVWDSTASVSKPIMASSPIGHTKMNKVSLTYTSEGGYTPGDAYDFYYGDDFIIKEWVYRKGNAAEPSMATTFENYLETDGLKIARDHSRAEGNWKLYFTNVVIIK